ncbi:MAG: ATP-dependent zinc metalloprotease FtsH [Thermoguttaceae bacterium]
MSSSPQPETPSDVPPPPATPQRRRNPNALFYATLFTLGLFAVVFAFSSPTPTTKRFAWSEVVRRLENHEVREVKLDGTAMTGKLTETVKSRSGKDEPVLFRCELPLPALADPNLDARLRELVPDVYSAVPQTDSTGNLFLLVSIGLGIVFVVAFFVLMRRLQNPLGGLPGFGRSLARRYVAGGKPQTFSDVAGLDNVKNELKEIVDYLRDPAKYTKMGARIPKGTLLVGPPGTGKTLLGRAVAGEAGVPFFSISGSEFIQMFAGVGASRVRDMFQTAKEAAPSILFIDEIDAVGRHRGTGIGASHDEREQTLNQILSEMDGFTPSESVMVMAATNRPDVLDPALLRPGRFDRHITVDRPTLKGRLAIFQVHIQGVPLSPSVDLKQLAKRTVGFTGADIRNLVNEATLWATRQGKEQVEHCDFDYAYDKVVMGLRREEVVSEEERRKIACHEAGHTIVGWFVPMRTSVHKVTIIPRGRSLGATYTLPDGDQVGASEQQLKAHLAMAMGGRIAERLVFGESPTGVENDLKQATKLARRMVASWGMSERIGPMSFSVEETHPFLGREIVESRPFSEATAQLVDEETVRFLREAEETAREILTARRELLEQLTTALEQEEELDQERLTELLGVSPFKHLHKTEIDD